jgi:membrane fusion protein, copper/silver efflux system
MSSTEPDGAQENENQGGDAQPRHDAKGTSGPRSETRRRRLVIAGLLAALLAITVYIFRAQVQVLWKPEVSVPHGAAVDPHPTRERRILYWQDPMHPQYRSDKPGKAPDCGMDLVPVYAEETEFAQDTPQGTFRITPEKQQLIGVKYGEVRSQPLAKTIRAVGRLEFDETRITHVHSKIEGWVERVYVDFTGKLIEKNQPLLSIYSPELLATQEEYLLALRAREKLGKSSITEVAAGASSLLDAARQRLELWDVSAEQIEELERTKKPIKAVTLYATRSGFVTARNVYERQKITPETDLYTIADLSTVWAIADIYEFEAPEIRLGQAVTLTLPYLANRTFRGKITYIYPQLDNTTRTLKVRTEFPNPDFALKPDMYANVELRIDYGKQLSVPVEAVLDSGSEQTVFVALDRGYFEPRNIQLGGKVGDTFIVLGGLKDGERIVTSGNFLIDSESKLKSATSGMGMPGMNHGGGQGGTSKLPATTAPASGKPSPQSTPEDHSRHQPKRRQE